jgi:hypothetical protein
MKALPATWAILIVAVVAVLAGWLTSGLLK